MQGGKRVGEGERVVRGGGLGVFSAVPVAGAGVVDGVVKRVGMP